MQEMEKDDLSSLLINKKTIISAFVWLLVIFLEASLLSSNILRTDSYEKFSIIIIANLIAQLLTLKICGCRICSFFSAFIILFYIFHMGQVVMLGIFPNYEYEYVNYITTYMHNSTIAKDTIIMCIVCINAFFFGGIIATGKNVIIEASGEKQKNLFHSGKWMFLLLFPFRFYTDLMQVIAALSGNYSSTFDVSLIGGGVTSALASIWYISLPLYYLELESKNRKKYIFFVVCYLAFGMLSGARGHAVIGLLGLMLVVILKKNILPIRKIIFYILLGLLGLLLLDLVFDMRGVGVSEFFSNIGYYISKALQNNIILETIGSFGETIFTPYLVLCGYGTLFSPWFGECFVKSIVSIVPDLFDWFADINNQAIFQKMLHSAHTIGGSFAADMYYNFGDLYWLGSAIIGFIYARYSLKVSFAIKNANYYYVYKYIPFLCLSLWWIRDSIGNMTRILVWTLLILYILNNIFKTSRRYK